MRPDDHLLIVGASARAAAFSALRAGLRPWCADLFADEDLRARCIVERVDAVGYPNNLLEAARQAPPGPWMYTGALENHPKLVRRLRRRGPLWGNVYYWLQEVRQPWVVAVRLGRVGVPCPAVLGTSERLPPRTRWLRKPLTGAGGRGIAFWEGQPQEHDQAPGVF